MNTHLNHEELAGLLLGTAANGAESHLRVCSECSRELEQMKTSIGLFRRATRDWSESEAPTTVSTLNARAALIAKSRRPFAGWLLAAAAIALIAIPTAYFVSMHHAQPMYKAGTSGVHATPGDPQANALNAAQQLEQDNALLSQIDSAIAEGVPASLRPLELSSSQTPDNSGTNR